MPGTGPREVGYLAGDPHRRQNRVAFQHLTQIAGDIRDTQRGSCEKGRLFHSHEIGYLAKMRVSMLCAAAEMALHICTPALFRAVGCQSKADRFFTFRFIKFLSFRGKKYVNLRVSFI